MGDRAVCTFSRSHQNVARVAGPLASPCSWFHPTFVLLAVATRMHMDKMTWVLE